MAKTTVKFIRIALCSKCKSYRPTTEFINVIGRSTCKACKAKDSQRFRDTRPELIKRSSRKRSHNESSYVLNLLSALLKESDKPGNDPQYKNSEYKKFREGLLKANAEVEAEMDKWREEEFKDLSPVEKRQREMVLELMQKFKNIINTTDVEHT